jgi:Mg2+ and Co2+ transporter CorA
MDFSHLLDIVETGAITVVAYFMRQVILEASKHVDRIEKAVIKGSTRGDHMEMLMEHSTKLKHLERQIDDVDTSMKTRFNRLASVQSHDRQKTRREQDKEIFRRFLESQAEAASETKEEDGIKHPDDLPLIDPFAKDV